MTIQGLDSTVERETEELFVVDWKTQALLVNKMLGVRMEHRCYGCHGKLGELRIRSERRTNTLRCDPSGFNHTICEQAVLDVTYISGHHMLLDVSIIASTVGATSDRRNLRPTGKRSAR